MPAQPDQRVSAPAHATGAVEFVALSEIAADETFRLRPDGDVSQLATSLGRLGQLAPVELRAWHDAAAGAPRWQVVSGFRRLAAVRLLARERVLSRLHDDLSDEDAWGLALGEALLREPLSTSELQALRERLRVAGVAPWADELVDEALVRAPLSPELRERFHDFLQAAAGVEGPSSAAPAPAGMATGAPGVEGIGAAPAGPELAPPADAPPAIEPGQAPPVDLAAPAPLAPTDEIIEVTPEELVQDLTARLWALNQDLATAFEAWEDLPAEGRKLLVEQARYVVTLLPLMEARG